MVFLDTYILTCFGRILSVCHSVLHHHLNKLQEEEALEREGKSRLLPRGADAVQVPGLQHRHDVLLRPIEPEIRLRLRFIHEDAKGLRRGGELEGDACDVLRL